MAIPQTNLTTDTFSDWLTNTNIIYNGVGEPSTLTTDGTTCVEGINELHSAIGDINSLDESDIITAINLMYNGITDFDSYKIKFIIGLS